MTTSGFPSLGLTPELLAAITKMNISEPTPIQASALPVLLKGDSAVLHAETGTGKTLAYALPIFMRLDIAAGGTQAIVLAPTHELALQIHRQCTDLAQFSGLAVKALLLIGGTALDRQIDKLKGRPHIVVGSPGRVLDLIKAGKLKAERATILVLDESDRLLGGDTLVTVKGIRKAMPKHVQLICASATEQPEETAFIDHIAPGTVRIEPRQAAVNPNITHLYMECEARDRVELLRKLLRALQPPRVLVFSSDDQLAERATRELDYWQMPVVELHPDFDKLDRKQAMDDFRSGRALVMVASDMAARGLDFPNVTHVINLDAPMQPRAYLHRVGRTGRAGAKGDAITMITHDQLRLLRRYEHDLGITLSRARLREGRLVVAGGPHGPGVPIEDEESLPGEE